MIIVMAFWVSCCDIRGMTTLISNRILKKHILQTCILKLQTRIDDFKSRIQSLLQTEGLGNEEAYDNNELSNNMQQMEEVNGINENLSFANEGMNVLEKLDAISGQLCVVAEPGAVVVTDRGSFFISVGIDPFEVDGQTFSGLSVQSPLFRAMKGKKAGQKFKHSGITYRIADIY
jgi:hypothetical protein